VIEYRGREEAIGRPFNLEFDDVMTGRHISIKQRRGKIVVIDLWATWCSPCVKEIPGLKEQYAKYGDSEVQLISKSVDHPVEQGGPEALKKYVADEAITWPQYHQGSAFDGAFSRACGVFSIPAIFVMDLAGNEYSTEARGNDSDSTSLIGARPACSPSKPNCPVTTGCDAEINPFRSERHATHPQDRRSPGVVWAGE
jgi:thiol-disulfide isomerase/thioredoxin